MEPAIKLITVRGIRKLDDCKTMPRQFVDYLRERGIVAGTKVTIIKREVWKYTLLEASVIQSIWYFRNRGFDLKKSLELADKAQQRRELKKTEQNLFADLAP